MQSKFKRILFGGDYNPNQWPKEVWEQDMAYFKDAHINSATINVFSWAKIQPSENEYNFTELDEIVDMLSKENYDIVMATSTAALPAWMVKKYPETMSTDYEGRRHKFGARHNFCPNSLVYQKYAKALATELVSAKGFEPVDDALIEKAKELIDACDGVICDRTEFGTYEQFNSRLYEYASSTGKIIKIPFHDE